MGREVTTIQEVNGPPKRIPLHQLLGYTEDEAPPALRRLASVFEELDLQQDRSRKTVSGSLGGVVTHLDSVKLGGRRGSGLTALFSQMTSRLRPQRSLSNFAELAKATDPAQLEQLPRFVEELRRQISAGLCSGAQISIRVLARPTGAPVGDATAIDASLGVVRAGVPMHDGILANWMSTSKPIAAVAIAQLWERGLIDLEAPVATYLPAFGCNGKETILVHQLLTHTAGFPFADVQVSIPAVPPTLANIWVSHLYAWYPTYGIPPTVAADRGPADHVAAGRYFPSPGWILAATARSAALLPCCPAALPVVLLTADLSYTAARSTGQICTTGLLCYAPSVSRGWRMGGCRASGADTIRTRPGACARAAPVQDQACAASCARWRVCAGVCAMARVRWHACNGACAFAHTPARPIGDWQVCAR